MIIAALMLAASPVADAKDILFEALDHYSSLKSFSMTIEHEHSTGLFPGIYTQSLRWRNDNKFELLVTKPQKFTKEDRGTNPVPNYFANGREVITVFADKHTNDGPLQPPANTSPGWEVSGGPILSMLQKTETAKIFKHPPEGMTMKYSRGTAKTWKQIPVREILLNITVGEFTGVVHWYLAETKPQLVGLQTDYPSMPTGTMWFKDQKENPDLPEGLGAPPK